MKTKQQQISEMVVISTALILLVTSFIIFLIYNW